MMASRLAHLLVIVATTGLACACASRQAAPVAQFALLPDPDDGSVGRATVSNPAGTKELSAAQESTSVVAGKPPSAITHLEATEVQRVFGEALAGLPPAPRHFTLYFQFDSDELTDASRRLVPDVLKIVAERVSPDVIVVGHTDTTGGASTNYQLGLQRASIVRNLLVAAGLDAALIEVASHGEADLLIRTPDETAEPRNRRVEIEIK